MLHRLKGGGFELRLKAGFGPPSADLGQVTVKLSSGSGGFWFLMYLVRTSSVTFPLLAPYGCHAARFHPTTLHWNRSDPGRLKAWGFLIPYRGL